MTDNLNRKLAAIMFADIVSYSRMMGENEQESLKILADFENISIPIVEKFEGVLIKKNGDQIFCQFDSAKNAVDASLKIQKELSKYNDSRPKDFKLEVRIGIHIGDVVKREDGDIHGDGVNVAARIQPLASPGGICVSGAVSDALSSHPDYDVISKGEQELKNILQKHSIFQVKTGYETIEPQNYADSNTEIKYFKYIIGIIAIIITAIFIGYKDNWWFKKTTELPISKIELNAEKTRIFIPYIGSRNELLTILNQEFAISRIIEEYGRGDEDPIDYKITPLSDDEIKELNDELITRVKTSFFPENIIYTSEDVEKSYAKIAQIPPDFTTFPTMAEGFLLDDSLKEKIFKPFNGFVADTLLKIMNQIDNNEYANHILISLNIFNIKPAIGNIEKVGMGEIIFRKVYDIKRIEISNKVDKSVKTSSTIEGIHVSNDRLIPDIISLINLMIQRFSYDEFIAKIESVKDVKVFIKMQKSNPLLKNTELSVMRQYIFQENKSIQNRINHIKQFMECCDNNSEDIDCKNFKNLDFWNKEEYDELMNKEHKLNKGQGKNQMSLNKIILIEEVYDSIAVGKIIKNASTCIKLLPGDLLKLNK